MFVTSSRLLTQVVLQAVSTVEEFAHIATNVVLENKATTWMLIDELCNIKYEIVENDQLATIDDSLLELSLIHVACRLIERDIFAQFALVTNFPDDQEEEEKTSRCSSNRPAKSSLVIEGVEVDSSGADDKLADEDDATTVPFMHFSDKKSSFALPWHVDFKSNNIRSHSPEHESKTHDEDCEARLGMERALAVNGPASSFDSDEARRQDKGQGKEAQDRVHNLRPAPVVS